MSDKELNDAAEKYAAQFGKCNCMHGCNCPSFSIKDCYISIAKSQQAEINELREANNNCISLLLHESRVRNLEAEINDLKLALADRSEKYKQFIDSGLWSKCEEIKRLRDALEAIESGDESLGGKFGTAKDLRAIARQALQKNGGGS